MKMIGSRRGSLCRLHFSKTTTTSALLLLSLLLLSWGQHIVVVQAGTIDEGTKTDDGSIVFYATGFCRDQDLATHQAATWQNQYPYDLANLPVGKCDGTITIKTDGSMCVTGKVNYAQLQAASGTDRPVFQLTAGEVSINGHMTGGSGYIWLGPDVRYLYDYITSYSVEGVEYTASSSTIYDNLLAASRGSIDGVCLSPDFRSSEKWYKVSHSVHGTGCNAFGANMINKIRAGSYTFISKYFTVIETHEWVDEPGFLNPGVMAYKVSNAVTSLFTMISMPDISGTGGGLLSCIPTNIFAPLARLMVYGTVPTTKFPVPVSAPDDVTEAVQIDTEYETLIKALENGLFTSKALPAEFYVRFKKVQTGSITSSCWTETPVIMEITGPQQDGAHLDIWIDQVVLPALQEVGGTVGLHFGKRIPPNTKMVQAALSKYEGCGATLNLSPSNCYHPQCTRKTSPDTFTFPSQYYQTV